MTRSRYVPFVLVVVLIAAAFTWTRASAQGVSSALGHGATVTAAALGVGNRLPNMQVAVASSNSLGFGGATGYIDSFKELQGGVDEVQSSVFQGFGLGGTTIYLVQSYTLTNNSGSGDTEAQVKIRSISIANGAVNWEKNYALNSTNQQ